MAQQVRLRATLDVMLRHPGATCVGVATYMLLTVPTHDLVQGVFLRYRDLVGLPRYHASVVAVAMLVAAAGAWPALRGSGRKLWRWWAWVVALAAGSFYLFTAVGSETVHFFQYAVLAVPLFALTRSAFDTVALASVLGAVDEAYQYWVLHPDWAIYLDFNDVLLNTVGAGLGVVWLASVLAPEADRPRARPHARWPGRSPAAWLLAGIVATVLALVVSGVVGLGAPSPDGEARISLNRGPAHEGFWMRDDWAAKPFHALRPVPGTALILLVTASFAALTATGGRRSDPEDAALRATGRRYAAASTGALVVLAAAAFPVLRHSHLAKLAPDGHLERSADQEADLDERLEWFADQKLGLLLHWGIYSVWGAVESWPIEAENGFGREPGFEPWDRTGHDLERFRRDYFALAAEFAPQRFDPRAWARAARDAGMRYVIFTAKHHDGFAMYDSAWTEFRTTSPRFPFADDPRADVLRRVLDAFRDEGLAVGIHFSKADWHHPDYWIPGRPKPDRLPNYDPAREPERWRRFVEFTHRQVEELMRDYGPVDLLELDAGWIRAPRYDIGIDRLVETARRHQPGLLVADRAVGGRHENFPSAEWRIPEEPPEPPWEMHVPVGWQMSFDFDDYYRPMPELIRLLVETVAKGGNLALGVGPRPDGTLPPEAIERLQALGDWLQVNGEAIYGTRMAEPYRREGVFFTRRADTLYAILLSEDGAAPLPERLEVPIAAPDSEARIHMLGFEEPLAWTAEHDRTAVRIPDRLRARPPSPWARVLRISRGAGTGS